MRSSVPNGRDDSVYMMHYFFLRALLFTLLNVVTHATSTVKPLAGNDNAKNAQCTSAVASMRPTEALASVKV